MEDKMKELMQELGNAINESLSDSERIASVIGEVKRAGYDVFLVLEATIGFQPRPPGTNDEDDEPEETGRRQPHTEHPVKGKFGARVDSQGNAHIRLSGQDDKFLKALKISIDDDENKPQR